MVRLGDAVIGVVIRASVTREFCAFPIATCATSSVTNILILLDTQALLLDISSRIYQALELFGAILCSFNYRLISPSFLFRFQKQDRYALFVLRL